MTAAFEELLPWMREQRWFPTDWQESTWQAVHALDLGETTQILLAQPEGASSFLQVPIRWEGKQAVEASTDKTFWADWLAAAGVEEKLFEVAGLGKEQSNTSVVLELDGGDSWVAKLFRVVYPGVNPDVELPLALRRAGYTNTPAVRAYFEPEVEGDTFTLGVATDMVENTGTAWDYFRTAGELNADVDAEATLLGRRIGQLYSTLTGLDVEDAGLTAQDLERRVFAALESAGNRAEFDADFKEQLAELIRESAKQAVDAQISRVHGDLHLGQVLRMPGGDWQVIDFEGEPLRSLDERIVPDFALRDLAGMLRSFNYAGWDNPAWAEKTRGAFLTGFAISAGEVAGEDAALLRLLEIEKALYEVEYEAQFRPDWLEIPLASIRQLLDAQTS